MDVQQIKELQECKKMMQNLPIGIYKTSIDGTFLKANDFCARMFGYNSAKELIGTNIKDVYCGEPTREKLLVDLCDNNNTLENYEVRFRLSNKRCRIGCLPGVEAGGRIWVAITAFLNSDNTLQGTMMCITERKRIEEELNSIKQKETERLKSIQNKAKEMLSKVA